MASSQCYYEILGVPRDATPEMIKLSYKKASRAYHPDRHVNKSTDEQERAAETFKKCAEAYEVLSDESKRACYDMFGHEGARSGMPSSDDMFEAMHGVSKKPRGVVGGSMFVDASRGHFFQRPFAPADMDAMRKEMTDGLPLENVRFGDSGEYVATMSLPVGPWEVRLVEVDGNDITVTLCAGDKEDDPEWKSLQPMLRLTRTFTLPTDADLEASEVTYDEGILSVIASTWAEATKAVPDAPRASSPRAVDELPSAMDELNTCTPNAAHMTKPPNRSTRRQAKQSTMRSGFLNSAKTKGRPDHQRAKTGAQAASVPMEVEVPVNKEDSMGMLNAGAAIDTM